MTKPKPRKTVKKPKADNPAPAGRALLDIIKDDLEFANLSLAHTRKTLAAYKSWLADADKELLHEKTRSHWFERILGMSLSAGVMSHFMPVLDLLFTNLVMLGIWWVLQKLWDWTTDNIK